MELFMAVLDGKVKIIPVYCHEYREVGAKLVARNNSANEFIIDSDEKDGKSYLMDQLDNCKCK